MRGINSHEIELFSKAPGLPAHYATAGLLGNLVNSKLMSRVVANEQASETAPYSKLSTEA